MNQKTLLALLGAVFAVLMALVIFVEGLPQAFSSVLAFPFEQIAAGLRALALAGNVGNGLALVLAFGIAALPVLAALRHRGSRAHLPENIALYCLAAAVLAALCTMANPVRLLAVFPALPATFLPVAKGIMGCTAWSVAVLWLVLALVRLFRAGSTEALLRYARVALYVLCFVFAAAAALSCGAKLAADLSAAQYPADGFMAVFRFAACALPYVLDIVITLALMALLDAFTAGDEAAITRGAGVLTRRCTLALGLSAAATAVLNVVQLVFARGISTVAVSADIPVVSLAFAVLILLVARLVVENRRLQASNDLFI